MTYYERNLPHWQPEGATFFVTWRLYGSLPVAKRTARNGRATRGGARPETAGERFRRIDKEPDAARTGPHWLKMPRIAESVVQLIRKGERELGYFALHAFVVMPNHVHLLLAPKIELRRIMNGLKGQRRARRIGFWRGHGSIFGRMNRTITAFGQWRSLGRFIGTSRIIPWRQGWFCDQRSGRGRVLATVWMAFDWGSRFCAQSLLGGSA